MDLLERHVQKNRQQNNATVVKIENITKFLCFSCFSCLLHSTPIESINIS